MSTSGNSIKVKFQFVNDYGKVKSKVIPFDFPEFKEIPGVEFKGVMLPPTSIESQAMEYLDSIDKRDFMNENGMTTILDYSIYTPPVKFTFKEVLQSYEWKDPQVLIDVIVAYDKMKGSLKGLNHEKKLKILLDTVSIGYQAKSVAYEGIMEIFDRFDKSRLLKTRTYESGD